MFIRFRQSTHRLQVSLAETRRVEGKVKHEHVASLGSVPDPPKTADRFAFWQALHGRLARLANRVDAATQAMILGKVHERIPMVTPDEQRALQLCNAKDEERFWDGMQEASAEMAQGNRELTAKAEREAVTAQMRATDAASKADVARERIAKIERGEDVQGGLGKPMTREDLEQIMRAEGMTTADIRHVDDVGKLSRAGLFDAYCKADNEAIRKAIKRIERRIARKMLGEGSAAPNPGEQ
jgi:hypothetical protein